MLCGGGSIETAQFIEEMVHIAQDFQAVKSRRFVVSKDFTLLCPVPGKTMANFGTEG
jgi:hypothetical protein